MIITTKNGKIKIFNLSKKEIININHNLNISSSGQGSIMDIVHENNRFWVSYSEKLPNGLTTSVASGILNNKNIKFKNIFRATPINKSTYHFGSRLVLSDDNIFITVGDRGLGMIAQDVKSHAGSVIKIKKNGTIPEDNPKYENRPDWLPEIFQIGLRNPQGLEYSSLDNNIYITNHGAKGGDWFGIVEKGENYGWKVIGWGGKNYTGTKIGPKWLEGYSKPIHYWVPSIGISSLIIYKGREFNNWYGNALIASLKDQSLRRVVFEKNNLIKEEIIFNNKIGRIRDIEEHPENGKIYLLSESAIWVLGIKN